MNKMEKTKELLKDTFESSSIQTEQYLTFHKTFKKEFSKMLKPYTKFMIVSKPNHFDVTGFFKLHNNKIYYFNLGDLRWNKEKLLIREAKSFQDYSGGTNSYIPMIKIENLINIFGSGSE